MANGRLVPHDDVLAYAEHGTGRPPALSRLWLTPVLLLATGVRLFGLGNTDLWGDEAFSVVTSRGPLSQLFGLLAHSEPHPPLYPLVLAGWLRVFGSSEFVSRVPSAFAGIASVAVAASLARSFAPGGDARHRTLAAVVAGVLVALNPFQVWYSQEARMYAQVSFFAGLATLALLRLWRGKPGGIPIYALAVLGAAGSHYYGLFVPLAHGVAVVAFSHEERAATWRWLRGIGLAAVLYLPWVVVALRIFTTFSNGTAGAEDLPQVALSAWVRVAAGWSLDWADALRAAIIVTAVAVIGIAVPARTDSDRFLRAVLVAWLLVPGAAGYALSLVRPSLNERYLIVSSLPLILLVARAVTWLLAPALSGARGKDLPLWRATTQAGLGIVALGGALFAAYPALQNVWEGKYVQSAYSHHTRTVDLLARNGDAVILDGIAQTQLYEYYAANDLPFTTLPRQNPMDPNDTLAELTRISQSNPGAWVFWYASPLYDPTNIIGRWLLGHAYHSFDEYATNARLQYYRFASDKSLATRPTSIAFGDAIELRQYGWSDEAMPAGGTIAVDLQWKHLAGPLANPQVALRLVDASGFTWTQTDDAVGGGLLGDGDWKNGDTLDDHHGLLIPTGTPPGDYRLVLNAYAAGHPQSLQTTGGGAPLTPGGVLLATIRVSAASQKIWTPAIAGFNPSSMSWANHVALLGSAMSQKVVAGTSGNLTLVWKALVAAPPVSKVRLRLTSADGKIAEDISVLLATTADPTEQWKAGDILREQYRLPISERLAAGAYQLSVEPLPSTGDPAPTDSGPTTIGHLEVTAGAAPAAAAPAQHPLSFALGSGIALNGFDLSASQARPGDPLQLTLHWTDLAPVDVDYTVFVHVLDAAEKVAAQLDQQPGGGSRPTSSWFAGDVILDRYTLTLPATLPPGDYRVEVGMYNASTGARLPVAQDGAPAGDRIIVARVKVLSGQ